MVELVNWFFRKETNEIKTKIIYERKRTHSQNPRIN